MSNTNDTAYIAFLQRLAARYAANTMNRPVFTTDADKGKSWSLYLSSFLDKQYHNCNTCHSFISHYANLVVVELDGSIKSALWNEDDSTDAEDGKAIRRLRLQVEEAKITGVFYHDQMFLGESLKGGWRHLHVRNPHVWSDDKPNAAQAMAKKREEFASVTRLLRECDPLTIAAAQALAASGSLYRAERVTGPLQWLADLRAANPRPNDVWLAVATAPAGYTHARSSMTGKLLKDIAAGYSTEKVIASFNTKMDGYQQAQTPPKAGQVKAAEQAVAELGIAPAFERRYTTEDDFDVDAILWTPSTVLRTERKAATGGVFAGLAPTESKLAGPNVQVPPRTMTWEKFARDVLPSVAIIEYRVPLVGRFCALTTAADKDAPPILQWDSAERRNPVAWCFPNPAAMAEEWGLVPGSLARVSMVVDSPNLWYGESNNHHGQGAFLLLEGARDTRGVPGGGLFVEHLRSELKPYRATIEAHMNRLPVAGADGPSMAFGLGLLAGNNWTEQAAAPVAGVASTAAPDVVHVLLVVDDSASMKSYIGAARRALTSLLSAVRAMPGKVDVTLIKFGNRVHVPVERRSLEALGAVENEITGDSGNTSLNDAIGRAIELAGKWGYAPNVAYFLGIVTDGGENHSTEYTLADVRNAVVRAMGTGDWTITLAGAGPNPAEYAAKVGIPAGNVTVFEASARGFEDVGNRYAASTRSLASAYAKGARASTSFFSSVSGRQAIGSDYPVLEVTTRAGSKASYRLDRWE